MMELKQAIEILRLMMNKKASPGYEKGIWYITKDKEQALQTILSFLSKIQDKEAKDNVDNKRIIISQSGGKDGD